MRSNNEPVRYKDLANGTKSIYLDTYKSGKRSYEFLKLYLLPEDDDKAKAVNAETLQKAEAIKNQRVQEIFVWKVGNSEGFLGASCFYNNFKQEDRTSK